MITVAKAMVKWLELLDVDVIFGLPGATICPFYDALFGSKIKHILVRHEQSAAHAASGYARVAGRTAVCVATSGPGALNLLTGIATAYMDSIPLVIITGQVSSEQLGRDVFQEADITGAAEPFVKHSYLVSCADEVQTVIQNAFHIASTGRKGPVLIDIPVDIQQQLIEFSQAHDPHIRSYNPNTHGHLGQIKRLVTAISCATNPLFCVGGGVFSANAQGELLALIEKCKIPVVSTMMGLGVISPQNPQNLGMVGLYGQNGANIAVSEADLLILVGARVGDRAIMSPIGLSKTTTIAHLDIDPAEIGKNIKTNIPIVGDAKDILTELAARITTMDKSNSRVRAAQDAPCLLEEFFMERLMSLLPQNTVVACDVGQNQLLAARFYSVENGRFLTSGGMGTMGYALPCALGAGLVSETVLCICGDGGFQMSMMELGTAVELAQAGNTAPLKLVVINNNSLGLVHELQKNKYNSRFVGVDFSGNPDFISLAGSYGMESCRVTNADEIDTGIDRLLGAKEPFLLEVLI